MSKFSVTPRRAYINGGSPRGTLTEYTKKCMFCGDLASYYSEAGYRELNHMTGMCEPCFDWSTIPKDDMTGKDEWIKGVKLTPRRTDKED